MFCTIMPSLLKRGWGNQIRWLSQIWIPEGSKEHPVRIDSSRNKLLSQISSPIRFNGPITVAKYMQEILTHPRQGYYMTKDVFGASGDFTTSPEVSQMFGECVGIWIVMEWMKMGSPKPLHLVEFGPGRGTLMCDILRTLSRLAPDDVSSVTVHMVELSPFLTQVQEANLCGLSTSRSKEPVKRSKFGAEVVWHEDLSQVPPGFSMFIANEFFDALPIHKFVKVKHGHNESQVWREVLIDVDPEDNNKLRWIRSRHETPANMLISEDDDYANHENVEISPKSSLIVKEVSERIVETGGAALICDYGHDGCPSKGDTFRAFKNNQPHDPLIDPGSADLTSDVNFAHLKRSCSKDTIVYGPVPQADFLIQLGIEFRLQKLLNFNSSNPKIVEELQSGFQMLVDPKKMGECFKFFAIFPQTMQEIHTENPPAGFKI